MPPQKSRRVKHHVQPNWINPEILQAIKTRDKHKKDKNIEQYKHWRNKVKSLINQSKTDYFSETINNNHNNPRQLWKNLHDITGKRKDHQTAMMTLGILSLTLKLLPTHSTIFLHQCMNNISQLTVMNMTLQQ